MNKVDVEFKIALKVEVNADNKAESITPNKPIGISCKTILGYTMSGFSKPGKRCLAIRPGIATMNNVSNVR